MRLGKFLLRVENLSLSYLKNFKHSQNSKLLRHAITLSEYLCDIEHQSGKTYQIVDGPSRRPFTEKDHEAAEKFIDPEEQLPLLLNSIADELLGDMHPSQRQQDKSHARHYRRHAQIFTVAPFTIHD